MPQSQPVALPLSNFGMRPVDTRPRRQCKFKQAMGFRFSIMSNVHWLGKQFGALNAIAVDHASSFIAV
jgi:hypothetical protein